MFAKHLILACASLVFLSARADAGLIVNGSFETPPVPAGTFTNFLSGSTAITGWTVVGIDSALVNGTFTQNGIVFQAQNGNQYIDLAGITSNSTTSGVTQNVATTAGMTYLLSFYVGSATDNVFHFASTVDLSINGSPRTSFTNNTAPTDHLDWKQFTTSFTATSATTNLTFQNGGAPNNFLSALDNVSVTAVPETAVPEPSSMILLAVGIVTVCFRNRCRPTCRC